MNESEAWKEINIDVREKETWMQERDMEVKDREKHGCKRRRKQMLDREKEKIQHACTYKCEVL